MKLEHNEVCGFWFMNPLSDLQLALELEPQSAMSFRRSTTAHSRSNKTVLPYDQSSRKVCSFIVLHVFADFEFRRSVELLRKPLRKGLQQQGKRSVSLLSKIFCALLRLFASCANLSLQGPPTNHSILFLCLSSRPPWFTSTTSGPTIPFTSTIQSMTPRSQVGDMLKTYQRTIVLLWTTTSVFCSH